MKPLILTIAVTTVLSGTLSPAAEIVFPKGEWERVSAAEAGLDAALLEQARDYALTGEGSGFITRHGRLVMSWGDVDQTYDLKSTTKSIGVTALGLAIGDGKVRLSDKAVMLHPSFGTPPESNVETGWLGQVTLEHLATQTAGFEKPGGYGKLLFEPGTQWHYSDAGPNWLAECLTLAYRRDMDELLFERVFSPIGITREDLRWRQNQYRDHQIDGLMRREFGSGVFANVDAMARLGLLYLHEGQWGDKQLLPVEFIRLARAPRPAVVDLPEYDGGESHGNASAHYGLLWWNNGDGTLPDVPRDAYWSWGLYDSLIVVIPSLDIVASRAGKSWSRDGLSGHYDVLKPFLSPIAKAPAAGSPDAQGTRITIPPADAKRRVVMGIEWAPPQTIVRRAQGSDNWPLTWADDDAQYTAYGDGWGFEPSTPDKLSLGLVRIVGGPDDFRGANVRSPTLEARGDDVRGRKASGLLCVDGTLYLFARNVANSQLAWSIDHGQSWEWADWRFTTSFGCPTFVNFGRDYAGARDAFVYVVSFDSDSAYTPADRLVLARVPSEQLRDRSAYEFFVRSADGGGEQPVWSRDVGERGSILSRPGQCYRCGVSYHTATQTYLLAMLPDGDTRESGGLAVFAASEPWGPWRTIFETDDWDVGPGESASFPAKWMSPGERTVHLVFSGSDSFSVRRGELQFAEPAG